MKLIRCATLALMITPMAAATQDFNAGFAAFNVGDYTAALQEWQPLAENGHAGAQRYLGIMYQMGDGVRRNSAEAVRWYRLAAKQGDAWAQQNLGYMYKSGTGVLQDYVSAHMWLNIAGNSNVRDTLAHEMTVADISEAQRRARICVASNYQDCD